VHADKKLSVVGSGAAAVALLFYCRRIPSRKKSSSTRAVQQKGPEGRVVDSISAEQAKAGKRLFFNNRICPFGHRAWWAALEKKVDIDYIHIDLGETKPIWYKNNVNHYGTVPCFYDQGQGVFESNNVAEYFEEAFVDQGCALMPSDFARRARVREIISKFDVGYLYGLLKCQDLDKLDEVAQAATAKLEAFAKLWGTKKEPGGPYFLGNELSLADIAVVPFLERFQFTLLHYREFEMLPQSSEHLAPLRALLAAARTRNAFQITTQTPEFFVAAYSNYGGRTNKELREASSY